MEPIQFFPDPHPQNPENPAPAQIPDSIRLYNARRGVNRCMLALFAMFFISQFLGAFVIGILQELAPALMEQTWFYLLIVEFVMYGIALPCGWLILKKLPHSVPQPADLRLWQWLILFLTGLGLMLAGSWIGQFMEDLLTAILHIPTPPTDVVDSSFSSSPLWLNIISTVLLAPILEEFAFRKLLLDRLHPYGETLAALTSAIGFGLYHGNFQQCFYAGLLGYLLAVLYLRTGRLRYTIAIHMGINLLMGVVSFLLTKYAESGYIWVSFLNALYMCLMIAGIICLLIVASLFRQRGKREAGMESVPKGKTAAALFGNAGFILYAILTLLCCFLMLYN